MSISRSNCKTLCTVRVKNLTNDGIVDMRRDFFPLVMPHECDLLREIAWGEKVDSGLIEVTSNNQGDRFKPVNDGFQVGIFWYIDGSLQLRLSGRSATFVPGQAFIADDFLAFAGRCSSR